MKNRLTIYIPTYNRAQSLLKQLHAISSTIDSSKVSVIVNDNASPNSSYIEVEKYCKQENFIYRKNYFNIGADANIFNGFMEFYNSEYIWILSDDDILNDDAISKVTTILENNSLDILFLTHSKIENLEVKQWTQKDLYEKNIKVSDGSGLISNVIYRSEFIKESIPVGFQNIYTCFAHLSILIHSFKNKTAMIGNIGSYNFFLPDTALAPADSSGYDRSFFGFVLLGEQFEDENKKQFVNDWGSFWNLRHWYKKAKTGKPNSLYAKSYIQSNISIINFFRVKLFFWYLFTPLLLIMKKKFTREKKDNLLKLFKINS